MENQFIRKYLSLLKEISQAEVTDEEREFILSSIKDLPQNQINTLYSFTVYHNYLSDRKNFKKALNDCALTENDKIDLTPYNGKKRVAKDGTTEFEFNIDLFPVVLKQIYLVYIRKLKK